MENFNCGIYLIFNAVSDKGYVGSTQFLDRRWMQHRKELEKARHCNRCLQNSWNKHGPAAFQFEILEYCSPEDLTVREAWWVRLLRSNERRYGYNLGAMVAGLISAEVRARMSAAQKGRSRPDLIGRKQPPEEKARQIAAQKGKPKLALRGRKLSEEHKAKVLAALKGRKHSEETKDKMSQTARRLGRKPPGTTGWVPSEETRAKIRAANKGWQPTDEQRAKMSTAAKGRKHSEAAKAKISAAAKGRKKSPETIEKLRASHKGYQHTDEAKAKMSASRKGKSRPEQRGRKASEETKAKLSAARTGKKQSVETIEKRRQTMKERYPQGTTPMQGKQHNEETKRKMAEARKAWWAAKQSQETAN